MSEWMNGLSIIPKHTLDPARDALKFLHPFRMGNLSSFMVNEGCKSRDLGQSL